MGRVPEELAVRALSVHRKLVFGKVRNGMNHEAAIRFEARTAERPSETRVRAASRFCIRVQSLGRRIKIRQTTCAG